MKKILGIGIITILFLFMMLNTAFANYNEQITVIPDSNGRNIKFTRLSQGDNYSSLNATATLNNLSPETVHAIFTIARYDKNNRLDKVCSKNINVDEKKQIQISSESLLISQPFNGIIKAYLWIMDESNITPLGEAAWYLNGKVLPPDTLNINEADVSKYTTTRYGDKIVNYHLTTPEQVAAGRKGSEKGQTMYACAMSDANPNRILLGSDCQMIYRSEDGGKSFVPSSDGINTYGIDGLEFYPGDQDTVFAMTSLSSMTDNAKVNQYVGIYKSTDGGKTWSQKCSASYYRRYSVKMMVFGDEKNNNGFYPIFAATHGSGILRSDDCGESWSVIGLGQENIFNIDKCGDVMVVVCGTHGVYKSTDDGKTWINANDDSWEKNEDGLFTSIFTGIAINPTNKNHWIVCNDKYLYETRNGGENYIIIAERNTKDNLYLGSIGKFWAITFGPIDKFTGDSRLYIMCQETAYPLRYSNDYGKSFNTPRVINNLTFKSAVTGFYASPFVVDKNNPDRIYTSFHGMSTDGGKTFYNLEEGGLSGIRASDFLFDKNNPSDIIIASVDHGIIRSAYVGNEWYPMMYYKPMEAVNIPDTKTCYCVRRDPKNNDRILATFGGWSGQQMLYESIDNGLNYSRIKITDDDLKPAFSSEGLFFHLQKSDIIYFGNYISTDNGYNWRKIEKSVCAMSESNGDVVYSNDGKYIYVSMDCGSTWKLINEKYVLYSGIQRITVDINDPLKIYVGLFIGGFRIFENNEWRAITTNSGLKNSPAGNVGIFSIAQNPNNPKHLIAGGCDNYNVSPVPGIFESLDGGFTWNIVSIPPPCDVWRVEFHPTRPQVFIATSGGTYVYEFNS